MRTEKSESTDAASTPIAADAGRTPVDVPPTPKPVSAKKRAANRANAARSTGPTSPEGKARSSMNAVRHGLAARAALLPGEDPEELEELAREMEADLRPRGAIERELVGRVVSLSWRLRRVARAEEALWADEEAERVAGHRRGQQLRAMMSPMPDVMWGSDGSEPPVAAPEQFVARQFTKGQGHRGSPTSPLERLAVYEQRLDRALHTALRQLQQLRKMRDEDDGAQQDDAPVPSVQNEPTLEPSECSRRACSARSTDEENGEQARRLHEDGGQDTCVQNEPTVRNTKPHGATNWRGCANEPTAVPAISYEEGDVGPGGVPVVVLGARNGQLPGGA